MEARMYDLITTGKPLSAGDPICAALGHTYAMGDAVEVDGSARGTDWSPGIVVGAVQMQGKVSGLRVSPTGNPKVSIDYPMHCVRPRKTAGAMAAAAGGFVAELRGVAQRAYENSAAKGFWNEGQQRNKSEMIALMHSELSELLEANRLHGQPLSEKIPAYTKAEEELADLVIRALDYAHGWQLRLGEAILAKMDYNTTRPQGHGKRF
jgi:NTP pyrophosphatase (non-canonical NTP hydrolase)